jgi:hypothetical protein
MSAIAPGARSNIVTSVRGNCGRFDPHTLLDLAPEIAEHSCQGIGDRL